MRRVAVGMAVSVTILRDIRSSMGRRVRHGQGDLRHAQRLALAGAGEDDVFHAGAAQALGALFAQDPTDGIAQVGFSAAVRTHYGRNAGTVEAHLGAIVKRLEALDIDALKLEQNLALHLLEDASRGDNPILN